MIVNGNSYCQHRNQRMHVDLTYLKVKYTKMESHEWRCEAIFFLSPSCEGENA